MAEPAKSKKAPRTSNNKTQIERGFAFDPARRNVDFVFWSERLEKLTIGFLVAANVMMFAAVVFAWGKPTPQLYISTSDGLLLKVDNWEAKPENLGDALAKLDTEERSLAALKAKYGESGEPAGPVPRAAAATPTTQPPSQSGGVR